MPYLNLHPLHCSPGSLFKDFETQYEFILDYMWYIHRFFLLAYSILLSGISRRGTNFTKRQYQAPLSLLLSSGVLDSNRTTFSTLVSGGTCLLLLAWYLVSARFRSYTKHVFILTTILTCALRGRVLNAFIGNDASNRLTLIDLSWDFFAAAGFCIKLAPKFRR